MPTLFDTDNSCTFSPELEVAEGAGSSPDVRNLETVCEQSDGDIPRLHEW